MAIEQVDSTGVPRQKLYFTVFHLLGLIFAVMIAFFLARAGWTEGRLPGLLGGLALAVLLAPIAFVVVSVLAGLIMFSLLFVVFENLPVGSGLARFRTVLRAAVIVSCIGWMGYAIPGLLQTSTWKEFFAAARMGVWLPVCAIFCLFLGRLERLSGGGDPAGTSIQSLPPSDTTLD